MLTSEEAMKLIQQGFPVSDETGEYFYFYDGDLVVVYHYTDKRYFISTKTPLSALHLYDKITYRQMDKIPF